MTVGRVANGIPRVIQRHLNTLIRAQRVSLKVNVLMGIRNGTIVFQGEALNQAIAALDTLVKDFQAHKAVPEDVATLHPNLTLEQLQVLPLSALAQLRPEAAAAEEAATPPVSQPPIEPPAPTPPEETTQNLNAEDIIEEQPLPSQGIYQPPLPSQGLAIAGGAVGGIDGHQIDEPRAVAASVQGKRDNNEDLVFIGRRPELDLTLVIVADGMGGHGDGEYASALAAKTFADDFYANGSFSLEAAFNAAHQAIMAERDQRTAARRIDPNVTGHDMGTTAVALLINGDQAVLGHAGDSRGYIVRDGELYLLTRDQSRVMSLIDTNLAKKNQSLSFPLTGQDLAWLHEELRTDSACVTLRSIIGSALGHVHVDSETKEAVHPVPEITDIALLENDLLVLCSDGLTDFMPFADFHKILTQGAAAVAQGRRTQADVAKLLLQTAGRYQNEDDKDNISVAIYAHRPLAVAAPAEAPAPAPAEAPAPAPAQPPVQVVDEDAVTVERDARQIIAQLQREKENVTTQAQDAVRLIAQLRQKNAVLAEAKDQAQREAERSQASSLAAIERNAKQLMDRIDDLDRRRLQLSDKIMDSNNLLESKIARLNNVLQGIEEQKVIYEQRKQEAKDAYERAIDTPAIARLKATVEHLQQNNPGSLELQEAQEDLAVIIDPHDIAYEAKLLQIEEEMTSALALEKQEKHRLKRERSIAALESDIQEWQRQVAEIDHQIGAGQTGLTSLLDQKILPAIAQLEQLAHEIQAVLGVTNLPGKNV